MMFVTVEEEKGKNEQAEGDDIRRVKDGSAIGKTLENLSGDNMLK